MGSSTSQNFRVGYREKTGGFWLVSGATLGCMAMALGIGTSPQAQAADDLAWGTVTAVGSGTGTPCSKGESAQPNDNVFATASGGELAFVFVAYGIDLPKTRSAFSQKNRCVISAKLTIPVGYALAAVNQVLIGSVTKDLGTSGGLTATTKLFDAKVPLSIAQLLFVETRAMKRTELIQRVTQDTITPNWIRWQCQATKTQPLTTTLRSDIMAYGQHIPRFSSFVMNLDSADIKLGLKPVLLPCNGSLIRGN